MSEWPTSVHGRGIALALQFIKLPLEHDPSASDKNWLPSMYLLILNRE